MVLNGRKLVVADYVVKPRLMEVIPENFHSQFRQK